MYGFNISFYTLFEGLAVIFFLHILFKSVIYLIFGLQYDYINLFNLTIYGIKYTHSSSQNVKIEIGRIKLHFQMFNKLKYFVRISITNVNIDLTELELELELNDGNSVDKKDNGDDSYLLKGQNGKQNYDPDAPVSIYPKDKKLMRLCNFLIKLLRHLSFKISNSNILITKDLLIVLDKVNGKTDINSSNIKTSFLNKLNNKSESSNYTWQSSVDIDNGYLFDSSKDQILSKFFSHSQISVNFQIDLKTGIATNLEPSFRLIGVDISILHILKLIKLLTPNFSIGKKGSNTKSDLKIRRIHKYKLYIYGFVYRLLKNANISLQSIKLSEIPIATHKQLNHFLEIQTDSSLDNVLFSNAKIDSFSLNVGPISENQVGYSLKFVEGSYPLQWLFTLANIKISLDFTKILNYTGNVKCLDILAIPNLLLTMESTMMINLLRVVFNNYVQESFIRKQTITIIQLTIANPSIDISTEQLSILLKVFKDREIDNNTNTNNNDTDTDTDTDNNNNNNKLKSLENYEKYKEIFERKKLYKNLFLDTLPQFQIKILLEKPIIIIKSENEIRKDRDIHLSIFQPSMIGLQLDAVTIERSMSISYRCDIPDLSFIYQRNNINRSAVTFASLKDINLKAKFQTYDLDSVKISLNLNSFSVDLTNLQVLNGLGIILNSLIDYIGDKNINNKNLKNSNSNSNWESKSFFKNLPNWFSYISFSIGNIKLKIGSKSLFIPPDELLDEKNEHNNYIDGKILTPSNVTYKIQKIELNLKNKRVVDTETDDSASTLQSETSKYSDDYYWLVSGKVFNSQIITQMLHSEYEIHSVEKILKIPEINSVLYCLKTNVFELSNIVDSINISHDVSSHFTIFSSFYILKNALNFHKLKRREGVENKHENEHKNKSNIAPKNELSHTPLFNLLNIKWFFKEIQFKMLMPGMFFIRLDLFDLKGLARNDTIIMEKKLIRLAIRKNSDYEFYNNFLTFDNMKVVCKLPNKNHEIMKLSVYDSNIKFSIPSNFIVHSIFDAIILTVKLTKKFMKSLKIGPTKGRDKSTPSGEIHLPKIKLKSNNLSFILEDDPFEAELGMIYQLGLLEQKNRLEKYHHFQNYMKKLKEEAKDLIDDDEKLKELDEQLENMILYPVVQHKKNNNGLIDDNVHTIVDACSRDLQKLRINVSKSWIKLVQEFKLKRRNTIDMNIDYLTGNLTSSLPVSSNFNSNVIDFNENPPLMGLIFNDFNASLTPPKFENDLNNVHEFLYRVGKGVPKDTEWDQVIPMRLVIKASEVRVHLRDFPLPFVYIPNSKLNERWTDTFVFNSTVVIAEQMPISDKEYWYLYIPMFSNMVQGGIDDKFYSWEAPKTICTVKTYYEIDCAINSDNSTMVTWSVAYQTVLRQLNISFDTFSKQTKDPSPKLGIWDKMRNILHGYARFKWVNKNSEVRFNILNSTDPYKLTTFTAGFTLVFKDNVEWVANDPDRELERDYFIFKSNTVLFGIPNFFAEPLPCWCSKHLIFLPSENEDLLITSMYGYYLNTDYYYDPNSRAKHVLDMTRNYRFKTLNICLDGDIEIKVSMLFERKLPDGSKTTKFKSHYENILTNPNAVGEKKHFDSYDGFRSDYIHMGLNLSAKNSQYNILRLTPRTFFQFFRWFKRFSSDVALPIRNGPLWNATQKSVSLGNHLMTFKFMFDVEPLYIYHGYRIDLNKLNNQSVVGLKAKIGSFKCDLHQRKEKMVKHIDFLDKNLNILKLIFYIGKVYLDDIDLRVVGLTFRIPKVYDNPRHKFEIFDNDEAWIDFNDYEEVDLPSIRNFDIRGQVLPLLHASHFCYWMDKGQSKNSFGNEPSHDCCIDKKEFPNLKYNHVFDVENFKFKWYYKVRNVLFEYIAEIEFRSAYIYSTSYFARDAISQMLKKSEANKTTIPTNTQSEMPGFNISSPEEFKKVMRNVGEGIESITAVDDMLIRFEDVQLQLMGDPSYEHLILFRTQHNEIEIVSLMNEDWFRYVKSPRIAKRFGTIFENADLIMITKDEYTKLNKTNSNYGTTTSWPAFLTGDEPAEFIESKKILSEVLIYFVMEKTSNSYTGSKMRNKLYLNIPKFETRIDSDSYLTFMRLAQNLLIYASPQQKQFAETAKSLALATEDQDKSLMLKNLEETCREIFSLLSIHQSLTPIRYVSEDEMEIDRMIRLKLTKLFSNSLLMSKIILMSCNPSNMENDDDCFMEWVITASNIKIDFLEGLHSFLSFTMSDSSFSRFEMLDGSTKNEVSIKKIQIMNKDYDILYPELLTSFDSESICGIKIPEYNEMLKVKWELGQKVGGMHDIKDVQILCHPMKICMEDKTGLKLMDFLFPDELKDSDNDSLVGDSDYNDEDNGADYSGDISTDDNDSDEDENKEKDSSTDFVEINYSDSMLNVNKKKGFSVPEIKIKKTSSTINISNKSENNLANDYFSSSDSDEFQTQSIISKGSIKSMVNSNKTNSTRAKSSIISNYSTKLNRKIVSGKLFETGSNVDNLMNMGIDIDISKFSNQDVDVTEMSERAKRFFSIKNFEFNDFILNVTLHGKGKLRLMNVNNLTLVVPKFVVRKQIWTSIDMVNAIKKHIIKTLLRQTGKLLRNKFFVYKRKRRINKLKGKQK